MARKNSKYPFLFPFIFWNTFFVFTFLILNISSSSAATQLTLEWYPNSEPDLAGYRIFVREQRQIYDYKNPSWEGTDNYCTIYDLNETKTYCFVARAFDIEGFESENSNEVCHEALVISNQPPIADAGPDQIVNEGDLVFLNGSNSTDPDDGIASYHWVQVGGELSVNLSDPDIKEPIFSAPGVSMEGATLAFELTVIDNHGNQGKDMCVVNVTWQNEPPQANAGTDQTVNEGVVVTLDGSSSLDIDDGISTYRWSQMGVPAVILSDPATFQPTFTAPNVGPEGVSLTFDLTVTDAGGLENTDSCIVNISWQNEPPTAMVSPDYMEPVEGTLITLDGSGSRDSDDGIASYLWTQIEGDPVSLSDPISPVTTFTAPKTDSSGKNLKFKLTVKDAGGLQDTAISSIYVMQNEPSNYPPIPDFKYATKRAKVTFTDQSADIDGTIVSWFWDFGDGHTSTDKNPRHWYRGYGTYVITLTVTDDGGARNSRSKTVTFAILTNRWNRWR